MSLDDRFMEVRRKYDHPDIPVSQAGNYVPAVEANGFLFLAGEGPRRGTELVHNGKVGDTVTEEQAYEAALLTGLNLIFTAQQALGSLDRVERVVEVFAMVHSADGFSRQPKVANGMSDVLIEILGEEIGSHTRCAVGHNELPNSICFEAKMTLQVKPS